MSALLMVVSPFPSVELSTNGTFASDTGWTKGAGWTIASGVASHAGENATYIQQSITLSVGGVYRIVFTVSNYVSGASLCALLSVTTVQGTARSANVTYTEDLTAVTGNDAVGFYGSSGPIGVFDIDNVALVRIA